VTCSYIKCINLQSKIVANNLQGTMYVMHSLLHHTPHRHRHGNAAVQVAPDVHVSDVDPH
jgi:hypothetical protein